MNLDYTRYPFESLPIYTHIPIIPYTHVSINKNSIYPTYITYINNRAPRACKSFVGKDLERNGSSRAGE